MTREELIENVREQYKLAFNTRAAAWWATLYRRVAEGDIVSPEDAENWAHSEAKYSQQQAEAHRYSAERLAEIAKWSAGLQAKK